MATGTKARTQDRAGTATRTRGRPRGTPVEQANGAIAEHAATIAPGATGVISGEAIARLVFDRASEKLMIPEGFWDSLNDGQRAYLAGCVDEMLTKPARKTRSPRAT